jgi:hypothetical protein
VLFVEPVELVRDMAAPRVLTPFDSREKPGDIVPLSLRVISVALLVT